MAERPQPHPRRPNPMRLLALLFTAILVATPALAQQAQPSATSGCLVRWQDTQKDTKNDKDAQRS